MKSISLAKQQFIEIVKDTLKNISPAYADEVKHKGLLTLPNEHLHGVIRMYNETPNVLDSMIVLEYSEMLGKKLSRSRPTVVSKL